MAPKTRKKQGARAQRKKEDPLKALKKLKLQALLEEFDYQLEKSLTAIETEGAAGCQTIEKMYNLALLAIPKSFHDMTLEQYEAHQKTQFLTQEKASELSPASTFVNKLESCRSAQKAQTAQKKKLTLMSKIKKKKLSADISIYRNNTFTSTSKMSRKVLATMQPTATPLNHKSSSINRLTAANRNRSMFFSKPVVTPKFDPRTPLPGKLLRKPRAGEVIMSLAGSPLQNCVSNVTEKPGIILSLGSGKVLNVTDPSFLNLIDVKGLDHETKVNLQLVHQKLAGILRA